jgi:3-deoxy-7-phosphoheptulonate synthase
VRTRGNAYGHIVLRGGERPNYDTVSISMTEKELIEAKFAPNIVVDCSHSNCFKDHTLQTLVMSDCVHQIREGNRSIVGLMLESNIEGGNQPIPTDLSKLKYGCSVTDPCIDWPRTESAILNARNQLKEILPRRATSRGSQGQSR